MVPTDLYCTPTTNGNLDSRAPRPKVVVSGGLSLCWSKASACRPWSNSGEGSQLRFFGSAQRFHLDQRCNDRRWPLETIRKHAGQHLPLCLSVIARKQSFGVGARQGFEKACMQVRMLPGRTCSRTRRTSAGGAFWFFYRNFNACSIIGGRSLTAAARARTSIPNYHTGMSTRSEGLHLAG